MDNIYSALHYAAKAKKSEEKAAEYLQQVSNKITAVEGSIGDIGIAPFGIDESQNRRRYLNGQVISQSQFESFTKKIKEAIAVNSNLGATEENWQAEVTNSKLGQCGKFVIDDALGTIRLPKVVNIQGLQDLSLLGGIKAESLPNIRGSNLRGGHDGTGGGAFIKDNWGRPNSGDNAYGADYSFDASRSSPTYQDNAPVQQEAIQYPYFIQVATGVEESVDVTREIELNNPFSLLDYKWSEYELNNASWLLSNGAFHSGATYVAVYELLLKIHNGTETKDGVSVKLSTEAYEDTDFVLNTADTTFRLPIKVKLASGNTVVGNGESINVHSTGNDYPIFTVAGTYARTLLINNSLGDGEIKLTTDPTKSGIETSSSGLKLYFYVGETIQDANVIVASNVLAEIANLKSYTTGMPDYSAQIELSAGTTEQTYTAPSKGYIGYNLQMGGNIIGYVKVNDVQVISNRPAGNNYYDFVSGLIPVDKNDVIKYYSNSQPGYFNNFQFYPVKGI
jgi:hypothetical protein